MDKKFQPGRFYPSRHPRELVHQSPSPPQVFFSSDADKDCSGTQHSLRPLKEWVDVGMTLETRNLYRKSNRDPWQEWSPKDVDIDGKSSLSSAKYALIVRHEYQSSDNDESTMALRSITVQSPLIKKLLGSVFENYKGINTSLRKLVFKAPFREFFFRWDRFIQADPSKDTEGTTEECSHFRLLADIIEAEIRPQIEQTSDLLNNGVISFDYIWALFEPGVEVFSHVEGHERLFTLTSGKYSKLEDGTIVYLLTVRYIDTDGDSFGSRATELVIWPFENLKSISELEAVPSHLQVNIDEVRQRLFKRGRLFESLKGVHHKSYSGVYTLSDTVPGTPKKQHVADGRIIIDSSSFLKYLYSPPEPLAPLEWFNTSALLKEHSILAAYDGEDICISPPVPVFTAVPHRGGGRLTHGVRHGSTAAGLYAQSKDTTNKPLSDSQHALCSHLVKGFCLKTKQWGYFDVDLVGEITWGSSAFDQLVLPHDYKQTIRAFVDAQMSGLDDFDDVIKGKGRGIIMLLSGEPGTGKTLTAESVAEAMRKPLYSMSAGELGAMAHEVEHDLDRVLELSARWGAVLLLDECDVFLERRSLSDMHRNKLVSIFLRLLEYYQGVMFLTTNRVSAFDPAFESRIHLTIHYPNLDYKSRLHIRNTFASILSKSELEHLAHEELNGRQIKNIVKTARLLATNERTQLAMKHVNSVLTMKKALTESA